jgi:predicted MPP superfamily phosphohydrolase
MSFFMQNNPERKELRKCDGCGELKKIIALGLCKACYSRRYKAKKRKSDLVNRLENTVGVVKILNQQKLTPLEQYVWERQSYDTIGELVGKTGKSVKEIELAYERGLHIRLGLELSALPLLEKELEKENKQRKQNI